MLPADPLDLYDVGHDPRLAGASVTPREAASIAAIAAEVRAAIYSGAYPVGSQMPTRVKLASDKGVSAESAGIVMRMLAGEGLVSLEQGRGTYVLPRRRFTVRVRIRRPDGGVIPAKARAAASRLLGKAAREEPAVSGLETGDLASAVDVSAVVETGGLAQAVTLTLKLVRGALRGEEGKPAEWDLDGASVEAAPELPAG